jgi:hypothetical protein
MSDFESIGHHVSTARSAYGAAIEKIDRINAVEVIVHRNYDRVAHWHGILTLSQLFTFAASVLSLILEPPYWIAYIISCAAISLGAAAAQILMSIQYRKTNRKLLDSI